MPRILRIQYPGARYHVINRGNYRSDIFGDDGAGEAFMRTLWEAAKNFEWKVHAYVLMRNHYHLALETPLANLARGMHWMQGTFASRFNRYRKQNGRLFQGPYKALPIEDMTTLCRVVDYIHLNPVRAGVVAPAHVGDYAWGSLKQLRAMRKTARPEGLSAADWLMARGNWSDTPKGIGAYERYLAQIGNNETEQKKMGLERLSRGWALGTHGWKQALARDYAQRRIMGGEGMGKDELEEIRQARNENELERALKQAGKNKEQLHTKPRNQSWKIEIAQSLRSAGVSVTWIAAALDLGKTSSLRSILSRHRKNERSKNQQ